MSPKRGIDSGTADAAPQIRGSLEQQQYFSPSNAPSHFKFREIIFRQSNSIRVAPTSLKDNSSQHIKEVSQYEGYCSE